MHVSHTLTTLADLWRTEAHPVARAALRRALVACLPHGMSEVYQAMADEPTGATEIAAALGLAGPSSIGSPMARLARLGLIERGPRGWRIVED